MWLPIRSPKNPASAQNSGLRSTARTAPLGVATIGPPRRSPRRMRRTPTIFAGSVTNSSTAAKTRIAPRQPKAAPVHAPSGNAKVEAKPATSVTRMIPRRASGPSRRVRNEKQVS